MEVLNVTDGTIQAMEISMWTTTSVRTEPKKKRQHKVISQNKQTQKLSTSEGKYPPKPMAKNLLMNLLRA
jgi:hypothetical protein